ncbi:MAG TPA: STAS domain-containing protein [Candidatus Elarobacter sp.]
MATEQATNRIVEVLERDREAIGDRWFRAVTTSTRGKMVPAEVRRELIPVLDALLNGAREGELDAGLPAFDEARALLGEYSRMRARQGFTPSETAVAVFALRDAVLTHIGTDAAIADLPAFSRFIDGLGLHTFETFAASRESVILNQTEQLLELSTPVVKLWDGILAVPLVGTLDSARTQVVMEALLETLVATNSAHAIIDITGVPAVDTQVAQHLLKTIFAARLMGAQCIISGVRPQIAQTIVSLGIDFGDIATKATVADALRVAFNSAGLEVRKTTEKRS